MSTIDQPMDTSSVSLSELEGMDSQTSESKSQPSTNNQKQKTEDDEKDEKYSELNDSAIEDGNRDISGLSENIEAVGSVTNKIEQFVTKISTNLKY